MDALLEMSALELAARVRSGDVSPADVVDEHIRRIEEVNPGLNAVVAERFEAARTEARATEARLRNADDLPPLFGVPCTIKEFFAVEGMPWTTGLIARRGIHATHDADAVARLRAAGAIVLGVTNVAEGGLWLESTNPLYGRTNNPWDLSRTAGGSTGGEAAIIAAGGSPFGLGADFAGSIRIPSSFCGIAGHKPTGGLVSNEGYWPPFEGGLNLFNCVGPMARRARDLWPLLQILSSGRASPRARGIPARSPESIDFRTVPIFPLISHGRVRIAREMTDAVDRATRALADRGAPVRTLSVPVRRSFEIWTAMVKDAADVSYASILGNGKAVSIAREIARLPFGRARHSAAALVVAGADAVTKPLQRFFMGFAAEGIRLRQALEADLGPNGVILHPPYSRPAPRHSAPLLTPFDFVCSAIFNVLGFPATAVPVGLSTRGLPVGVQAIAARGNDALTIAAATALEDAFGGWRMAMQNGALKG